MGMLASTQLYFLGVNENDWKIGIQWSTMEKNIEKIPQILGKISNLGK